MFRLASASPRRIELLRACGVDVTVVPADVDEQRYASPATAKADAVSRPGTVTLAVDTEVELDGTRLGKPRDRAHALELLRRLAGREHDVRSEVVVSSASGRRLRFAVITRVRIVGDDEALRNYAATDEPLDKAGAYAIQGEGRRVVESFAGCFANVTGLPLCHVYFALRRSGVATRERPEIACQEHFDFVCPVWRLAQRQARALHDGEYASWSEDVTGSLSVTMSVADKLRVGPGDRVALLNTPSGYGKIVEPLPEGATLVRTGSDVDVVLVFASALAEVGAQATKARKLLKDDGILWIAYPKGGGRGTDLNRDVLREHLAKQDLDAVSLVALDDTWSAMRFKPKA